MKRRNLILTFLALILIGVILTIIDGRGLLNEGDSAPDFTSKLSTGETISLGTYRGKKNVVLFFYPRDFTPGCTRQACSFRDNYDEILRYDAVIFGISADDEDSHKSFIAKYKLPFSLISDEDKAISKAYGTANRLGGLLPGAKRVTYLIDKQGVIRRVIHHELQVGKHIEEVVEGLKSLQ